MALAVVLLTAGLYAIKQKSGESNKELAATRGAQGAKKIRALLKSNQNLLKIRDDLASHADITEDDKLFYANVINEYCYAEAHAQRLVPNNPAFLAESHDRLYYRVAVSLEARRPGDLSGEALAQRRSKAVEQILQQSAANSCGPMASTPITFETVKNGWRGAAEKGEVRSIAAYSDLLMRDQLIRGDIALIARGMKQMPGGPSIDKYRSVRAARDPTPEHIEKLKRAFKTLDAALIISLGPSLVEGYEHGTFVFGPDREELINGGRAMMWPLIACEFGLDCAQGSNMILANGCYGSSACAEQGMTLEKFAESQMMTATEFAQYRRLKPIIIEAFKSGDWSQIQFRAGADRFGITIPGNGFRTPFSPARW